MPGLIADNNAIWQGLARVRRNDSLKRVALQRREAEYAIRVAGEYPLDEPMTEPTSTVVEDDVGIGVCGRHRIERMSIAPAMSNSKSMSLLIALAATCISAWAQAPETDQKIPEVAIGKVIPRVVTLSNSHHSYALYVPSYYTPRKKWPVVCAFDSRARGLNPVDMLKPMAEKYGYVVARL